MHTIIHNINNDNKLFIKFSIQLLQIDLQIAHVENLHIELKVNNRRLKSLQQK